MKAPALAGWLAVAELGLVGCHVPNEASTTDGVRRVDQKPESGLAPEPVGGSWVSCYANYRPTSTPERDVTRLGLVCGPENGMVLLGTTMSGHADNPVEEHVIGGEQGECWRLFAVAEATVAELAVEVGAPNGARLASDHNGDRWPVLNPEGPFCLLDSGKHTIRVRARRGRGQYALQVWRLADRHPDLTGKGPAATRTGQ